MGMTRQERIALHKKQERLQVQNGVPLVTDLKEGIPVFRFTDEGMVEYIKHNGVLFKKILDEAVSRREGIDDYVITWSANEPTASSTNTIDDGNTVGDDNEGGKAIADLTAKVNRILNILRVKNIIT